MEGKNDEGVSGGTHTTRRLGSLAEWQDGIVWDGEIYDPLFQGSWNVSEPIKYEDSYQGSLETDSMVDSAYSSAHSRSDPWHDTANADPAVQSPQGSKSRDSSPTGGLYNTSNLLRGEAGWVSYQMASNHRLIPKGLEGGRGRRQRGRIGALKAEQRTHAALMRLVGSCSNCKIRKERCDPGTPCKSCLDHYKTDLDNHPCRRGNGLSSASLEAIGSSPKRDTATSVVTPPVNRTMTLDKSQEEQKDKERLLDDNQDRKELVLLENEANVKKYPFDFRSSPDAEVGSPQNSTSPITSFDRIGWRRDSEEATNATGDDSSDSEWWSENSSADSEITTLAHDLTGLVPKAAGMLFPFFAAWCKSRFFQRGGNEQGNNTAANSTQSCGTSTKNGRTAAAPGSQRNTQSNLLPPKRPSDEEEQDPPRKRRKSSRSPEHANTKILACPFAKNNPFKHRTCFKYQIQEISRLKQHLLRVHQIPIHCAKCFEIFRAEDDRDSHLRETPGCTVKPRRTWDGISGTQKRQLAIRVSTKKSKEENWYLIYSILFPNSNRPESPYVDNTHLAEELFALREFAAQEAPARIAAFAQTSFPQELRESQAQIEQFTQAAVENVLDMVIQGWLARRETQNPSNAPTDVDSGYLSVDYSMSNASSSPSQQLPGTMLPASNADRSGDSQTLATTPSLSAENIVIQQQTASIAPRPETQTVDPIPSQYRMENPQWLSSVYPLNPELPPFTDSFNPDFLAWHIEDSSF